MNTVLYYSKAVAAALVSGLTAASAIGGSPHWITISSAALVPVLVALTTNAPSNTPKDKVAPPGPGV